MGLVDPIIGGKEVVQEEGENKRVRRLNIPSISK